MDFARMGAADCLAVVASQIQCVLKVNCLAEVLRADQPSTFFNPHIFLI
jgi:hypothetical protein